MLKTLYLITSAVNVIIESKFGTQTQTFHTRRKTWPGNQTFKKLTGRTDTTLKDILRCNSTQHCPKYRSFDWGRKIACVLRSDDWNYTIEDRGRLTAAFFEIDIIITVPRTTITTGKSVFRQKLWLNVLKHEPKITHLKNQNGEWTQLRQQLSAVTHVLFFH